MYPGAAEKIWATFFWFYPLKQLFFWSGSRFPGRRFRLHRNRLPGNVLYNISDGLSMKYDELIFPWGAPGCPDSQRGGSAGRGTPSLEIGTPSLEKDDVSHSRSSRLGIIKIMNADIIEVKNNESLMQCYHLMVVVNKM